MIRIANGQGFWGDWLEAPVRLVEQGPIDYLALDYLAEITMSILQKQKQADPNLGYARDFPPLIAPHRAADPRARRQGDRQRRRRQSGGLRARSSAASRPDSKSRSCSATTSSAASTSSSPRATRCATWTPASRIAAIRDRILSANAYIGAFPLAEALATGADVVIAGRSTDTALDARAHGPPLRLEAPTSTTSSPPAPSPATSSNAARSAPAATARWIGRPFPDMANIGYPIVEAEPDGSFTVTKHPGAGGRVTQRHRQRAAALRTRRPEELHHARLRRRLHQHPAARTPAPTACASPASAAVRGRRR